MKVKCGDANPKGNIAFSFKGGCGEELNIEDAYRCTGCGGWFHHDCILKHFELEEGHDNARYYLAKIALRTKDNIVKRYCRLGLEKQDHRRMKELGHKEGKESIWRSYGDWRRYGEKKGYVRKEEDIKKEAKENRKIINSIRNKLNNK